MRILRVYGGGAGTLLLVTAIILSALIPDRWIYLSIGGFGLLLLLAAGFLNREAVAAVLKGKRARAAGASVSYVLTVLGVIVLLNFLAGRHHKRFDLTENQAFSLSEQTIKVLKALPREVSITAFLRDGEPARQKLQDLLDEYQYHSRRLTVRYVDPDKNPGEVKRYGITKYGTLVFESGKQEARADTQDEESLTNALIKVTRDRERTIYFTTGHGERSLDDGERNGATLLKSELEKQHYAVRPLVLNQGVPADATAVVIAGPQKAFLEAEARMIGDYLETGGRILCLQDPGVDPGLESVLSRYGVGVRKDVVIDKVSQLFGGDARIPMVPADGYDEFHPVTKTFQLQTFYPLASSISIADTLPEGVTATKLAQTSPYSWGETSDQEFRSGSMRLDQGKDTAGPVTIGAAMTRKIGPATPAESPAGDQAGAKPAEPEVRLLLFGDSDFLSNAYFNASGNGDLALSGIAWLSEQEELVSIRPKTSTPRIVILTPQQVRAYFLTMVAVAPIAITVVGVGIWLRRRKL
jgi:ABC-type uncharacterized transport system involved in gliding motility auxiliary subunit